MPALIAVQPYLLTAIIKAYSQKNLRSLKTGARNPYIWRLNAREQESVNKYFTYYNEK